MDKEEALKVAKEFNKWRRGANTEMLNPEVIGIALDVLIEAASQKNAIAEAIRATATSFPLAYLGDVECKVVGAFLGGRECRNGLVMNHAVSRTFLLFVAEAIES